MTGAVGQRRVPAEFLKHTLIPLPPLSEQRRIVAKLDALSARSKRARAELDIIRLQVAKCRNALLRTAFCGELTREWRLTRILSAQSDINQNKIDGRTRGSLYDLPAEWAWTAATQIASVSGGLTKNPKRKAFPRRVPYLRVANVYSNELRLDDVSVIGCTDAEFSKTRLLADDLLIVEGNGSLEQIGRVALWNGKIENCLHQNHLIRVRLNSSAIPRFVLYWLLSPAGRSNIERIASSTSGLHTLSITKVEGLPVPICDLEEQHEIVRRIETAFATLDHLAAETRSAAALLDRLDQAILAKAFRGELVPQDPNDEPASMLLDRIRAASVAESEPTARRGRLPRMSAGAS
jgi:type I restriction enzyme S subunit